MAKQVFREKNFRPEALERIDLCNLIIEEYQRQGLRMTLRQLYYQLVTRNAIRNEEKAYKSLGGLLSDARLAGLVDWDAIEDRARQPRAVADFENIKSIVSAAMNQFRLPRWEGQEAYVELWVEKDALAGVLWPLARKHHVTLMVNRGYSSQSAMYESAERFINADAERRELLYLGDHDPSGEDMVRDVEDRLTMFGVEGLTVTKVALTMDQVEQYKPPPNPTKLSDSRASAYVEKFGYESWEVDALPPNVLTRLIERELVAHVDREALNAVLEREEKQRAELGRLLARMKSV